MSLSELERYRIADELGRGAMGIVYRAWDLTLERDVALKELTFPAGLSPAVRGEMVERFLREARSAARLAHPNVIQVYDVFSDGERYFIAMELLSGVPLSALMDRGGLPAETAAKVMLQVLDGVEAAHAAGVVHRDLKPDNIYVLDDGRVKVTDFGIAKAMGGVGAGSMTQVGTVIGTPGYMAPEQVRGERVDGRADLFALGVVFYEMLAGVNPFLADSPTTILYCIVHEDPPPIRSASQSGNSAYDAIAHKALAKDPAARYQTAAAMAADIRGGTAPTYSPIPVGSMTSAPGVGASGSRGNLTVILSGAALALVAAGILFIAVSGSGTGPTGAANLGTIAPSSSSAGVAVGAPVVDPPVVPAPAAVSSPSEVPVGDWAVFFGAYTDPADAESRAARAQARGFSAGVLDTRDYPGYGAAKNESRGIYCYVPYMGPFASESGASAAASELKRAGFTNAYAKINKG